MRKILFLAPFDIFPPVHGGSAVVHNLIKRLSKLDGYQITILLTHLHSREGAIDIIGSNVSVKYCPRSIFDKLRVINILFNPYYFRLAGRIATDLDPDIIQCEILWTTFCGIYLKRKLKKPMIYSAHNVEYLKFKDLSKLPLLISFIKKVEKTACHSADRILTLSDIDKEHLIHLYNIPEERIKTISPVVDLDIFKYHRKGAEVTKHKYGLNEKDILLTFVGNLNYPPNVAALKAISEVIYPQVIEKYPNTKFLMVGQGDENVKKYKKSSIIFTGYVKKSELINLLSATDIFLVPIESGSGIRVKILEAAACSRAIVSTKKGAEGLSFVSDKEILLSNNVDSNYINAVMGLIEDNNLRKTIGENARKRVAKEYSCLKKIAKLEKTYEEVNI